jgi:hypothetical protein
MERLEECYLPPLFHKFALDEGRYTWKLICEGVEVKPMFESRALVKVQEAFSKECGFWKISSKIPLPSNRSGKDFLKTVADA